jgi:hypothetical protein
MRGSIKQTSGAGYSSPAYLDRGWMRGRKAKFRCRLQFSCLLWQRLDEGVYEGRGWLRRVKQAWQHGKSTFLIYADGNPEVG